MNAEELKDRFKKFALRIMNLTDALPKTSKGMIIGGQLLRSGTSSAANYRAACRARSSKEFISKLCVVEEELDESMFWMEVIMESKLIAKDLVESLYQEANELLSIVVSSKKTSKKNGYRKKSTFENRQS